MEPLGASFEIKKRKPCIKEMEMCVHTEPHVLKWWPFGLQIFNVKLFEMKNALATFQRFLNILLEQLDYCAVAYLDDIAVLSATREEPSTLITGFVEDYSS